MVEMVDAGLVAQLRALVFTDAEAFVSTTPPEVIRRGLHRLAQCSGVRNPGGWLRWWVRREVGR